MYVNGKHPYNRYNLIEYHLNGEIVNEKNLIIGTRYIHVDEILSFENMIANFVKETSNHVIYHVMSIFDVNNLLANGALM